MHQAQTSGRILEVLALTLMHREIEIVLHQKIFGLRMRRCSPQTQISTSHSLLVMEVMQHSGFLEKKATQLAAHLRLSKVGEQTTLEYLARTIVGTTIEMLVWYLVSMRMAHLVLVF